MKMTTRFNTVLAFMLGLFTLSTPLNTLAQNSQSDTAVTLVFQGDEYQHRWSKQGQNEFTPSGQESFAQWRNMLTINVYEKIITADQLAVVAKKTLGLYQENGHVLRANTKPSVANSAAEYFISGVFVQPAFVEAAFSRFMLRDGVGIVAIYYQRFYGENAQDEMLAWVEANGKQAEDDLMSWQTLPSLKVLNKLSQM